MNKQANKRRKFNGRWLFLISVVLIYTLVALLNFPLARESFFFFGSVLLKVIPVLFLVFVLMVIFNMIMTPTRIEAYLGKASGIKGWLLAMLGGVLATGPIYTWYVLIAELKEQGMKNSLAAAFLYSRAVKLPLLPLLIHYFGITYTLMLTFYLLVFSVMSGKITGLLADHSHQAKQLK